MNTKLPTTHCRLLTKKGATLIELLLYLAISSGILMALVIFAWDVIGSGVKSAHQQDAGSSIRYISERIRYEVRNASDINSVSATSISLASTTPANNPTIVTLSGDNITIQQGSASAVNLNPTSVKVTALNFNNYSSADSKTKHIQFTLTTQSAYPSRGNIYDSASIESSAEARGH